MPLTPEERRARRLETQRKYRESHRWQLREKGRIYGRSRPRKPPKPRKVLTDQEIADRFWPRVEKTDGCWIWTRGRDRHGYGLFCFRGKRVTAYRTAWILTYGPVPEGLHVLHRCDHPPCVRPDHLFVGTHRDNMLDKEAKGRAGTLKGSRHARAIFSEEQILAMRADHANGVRRPALVLRYGVNPSTLSSILSRRTWPHT